MSQIGAFNDFMLLSRQNTISGPNEIPNESTRYQCYLLRLIMEGLAPEEYIQDGNEIVDFIQTKSGGSYEDYAPTQNFTYSPTDTMVQIRVPWRHSKVHMTWTDHEVLLNNGTDQKSSWKRLKKAKEQAMNTDFYEGMEDSLWRTPNSAQMEGAPATNTTGIQPYSLRAFLTDDGLAPSSTNGGVTGSNWTTVQGVNITNEPNFRNQVSTYDGTSTTTVKQSLIEAFDKMWLRLNWKSPINSQQYFSDTNLKKLRILVSEKGATLLNQICRESNDRLTPATNLGFASGGNTQYGNIPIEYVTALNTVDNAKDTAAIPIPRFRFFNFAEFRAIYHKSRYLTPIDLSKAPGQPFQNVMLLDTWRNLLCRSRRKQGMVTAA